MKEDLLLDRIVVNPRIMVGKPIIRGTRLTVEYILNLLAHGATENEILAEYDGLTRLDIQASRTSANESTENTGRTGESFSYGSMTSVRPSK
jgi:uncharacterized protein (DUF433 family)